MRRHLLTLAVLPLLAGGLVLAASPAQADDITCRGTIGAISTDDNVIVPSGATCRLRGTRIDGNVEVKRGATLIARGVRVDGNIQADGFRRVVVAAHKGKRSRVDGNIQLEDGGKGRIVRTTVDGDIQLEDNGRFKIRRNRVDGNLQCEDNSPRPTGRRNQVNGDKEGQCRRL